MRQTRHPGQDRPFPTLLRPAATKKPTRVGLDDGCHLTNVPLFAVGPALHGFSPGYLLPYDTLVGPGIEGTLSYATTARAVEEKTALAGQ